MDNPWSHAAPYEPDQLMLHPNQRIAFEAHLGFPAIDSFLRDQFDARLWHCVPDLPSRWHPRKRRTALRVHRQMLADHVMAIWFAETRRPK